jgi:DNA (cytosine-5)-methyltransferase 1
MKKHDDDITSKTITHLSLCSGYEGIGLGLRRIFPNLREIAYVEREGFAVANLVAKMETGELDAAPVFTDVKTFPYRKFRGRVDILSGGFPCQPFSTAGKREGVKDPRHLFPYIRDGIAECRPRLVFLENVEGIITSKTATGTSVLRHVLEMLEFLGYRATAGVFSAAEVGAPHQRKRVFILGYTGSSEPSGLSSEQREKVSETRESSETMANRSRVRSETRIPKERTRQERNAEIFDDGCNREWPSRPGEPQQVFEKPRTQPKLGRTTDGAASRVDRLRLLGNGVVPATAEKAFLTLINKLV